jgi:hypothetical protein
MAALRVDHLSKRTLHSRYATNSAEWVVRSVWIDKIEAYLGLAANYGLVTINQA